MVVPPIWTVPDVLSAARATNAGMLVEHLGIEFIAIGDNWLEARMPVVQHNKQPAGLLHGGASLVLAESLASVGCFHTLEQTTQTCVGLEINANHLRGVRDGFVYGRATPVHRGRSTQVWEIRLRDDEDRPTCLARCTMAVLTRA
jgi:1,4-dihydroxy-2-naphthoyl-CoA hydrolase